MPSERVALAGSLRKLRADSQPIGVPDPNAVTTATVLLRRRTDELPEPGTQTVTREEFAARFGASPDDLPPIEEFAAENDLTVVEIDFARRSVVLAGTLANLSWAFGTELLLFQSTEGPYRGRIGELFLPTQLDGIIVGVFGLDERPQARTHFRTHLQIGPKAAGDTSYTPAAVSKLYGFPTQSTGAGQCVAIIELGGGYRVSDLNTYFKNLGLKTPSVTAVSVDGGLNQPVGDPNSADGEVLLDIEVVGAIAPGAKIAVYFAPNTDQGFLDAITRAVHDTVLKPSVVSISWGGPESSWTAQALSAYDQAFHDATLLGVTICCASGDDGSADGVSDGAAHVDFPSSSPNVLACGGTRLESSKNKITKEVVWNHGAGNGATGGGVSETFAMPSYQASAKPPVSVNPTHFKGRGVPDVSGDADPATGYQITVDGRRAVFGGTSAVAPLWAALIALINAQTGRPAGFLNPKLYAAAGKPGFRDITSGNNGAYTAGTGWDACTGLGSPVGASLLTLLSAKASGGKG